MEKLIEILRESTHLTTLEMVVRGMIVFVFALIILRIAGKRTFGRQSPSDYVVMIMIGALLTRAIVGASPFLPVIAATLVVVLIHRLITWLSFGNKAVGNIVKGRAISLFKDGKQNEKNMRSTLVTHDDLMEGVRLHISSNNLKDIQEIFIERNGEISVVKKQGGNGEG